MKGKEKGRGMGRSRCVWNVPGKGNSIYKGSKSMQTSDSLI